MMGAGKTTVGRQLARRLNKRFVDSDHEIEARTGARIPLIFEIEGEAGFRKRECQVLEALAAEKDLVLATGGGAVTSADNRRVLRSAGLVVYLHVPLPLLFERVRHDRNRPLLQVEDPLGRLRELLTLRDPLYREVADLVADGGRGGARNVVRWIETEWEKQCAN